MGKALPRKKEGENWGQGKRGSPPPSSFQKIPHVEKTTLCIDRAGRKEEWKALGESCP